MPNLPKIEYLFDPVKEYERKGLVNLDPICRVKHGRHADLNWIRSQMVLDGRQKLFEFGAWPCDSWKAFVDDVDALTISDSFWWARERWHGEDGHPTIEEWTRTAEEAGILVRELDVQDLDMVDLYDYVYSVSVLEHVHDDMKALRNIFRSLTPGGMLIMTVEMNPYVGMEYDSQGCYRVYTPGYLCFLLEEAGFEVNYEQEDYSQWEREFRAAVANPALLKQPYKHFASTGIAARKPR